MTLTTPSSRVRPVDRPSGWGRRSVPLLMAVALAAGACTTEPSSDPYRERLDTWRAGELTSYAWTLEVSEPVLGPRRVRVRVQDGEPISAVAKGEPVPIEGGRANGIPATVDALIELLIDSAKDAKSVQVQWNEEAGYPTLIDLDLSPAIDDEITYRVISFEALG